MPAPESAREVSVPYARECPPTRGYVSDLEMSPYVYDVLVHMMFPVRALAGDRLVVAPGHPDVPVAVVRFDGVEWRRVRVGPPNYGGIILQEDNKVIRLRVEASVALAAHPLVETA